MPNKWRVSKYFDREAMTEVVPTESLSRREHKKIRQQQRQGLSSVPQPIALRLIEGASKFVGYAAGFVGAAAVILSFLPAFSVSKEEPLNPHDPFSVPFIIEYDGLIPIRNVTVGCGIYSLQTEDGVEIRNLYLDDSNQYFSLLWHGDAITIYCPIHRFFVLKPIVDADVFLEAKYRPWLLPRFTDRWWSPWTRTFRYATFQQADKNLRWLPELNRNMISGTHAELSQ